MTKFQPHQCYLVLSVVLIIIIIFCHLLTHLLLMTVKLLHCLIVQSGIIGLVTGFTHIIRAPDKLLFGVKYSIILSKNQLSFKRWGTVTQLIDRVPYLFQTSGVNLKTFPVRKACRSLISEIKGVLYALT